jgi:cytochrome P450
MGVREAARDIEISGRTIAKGTMVGWSPYLSGRDPRVWPEPLRFNPDRGLELDDSQRADTERAGFPSDADRTCASASRSPNSN